mmetsp:Transcript_14409/g.18880  ORF Transcript_14409/g.18880 Transcript_14409/m.18880 type:complete len:300 (-) Transcript_14409:33-932(-)
MDTGSIISDTTVQIAVGVVVLTTVLLILLTFKKKKIALDSEKYIPFKLIEKEEISHDTRRFRFALQSKDHVLGLPIGQHISFRVMKDGKPLMRSYTPTSSDDDIGFVEFVIKVYFANVHPKFPDGGAMSQHLETLKIGDTMDMKGPKGSLDYKGKGNFAIKRRGEVKVKTVSKVGMMAGGTGITPMLQVISAILKEGSGIELSLLFANQTEDDILVRKQLEDLAAKHSNFKFWYTLDRPPSGWKYSEGFINTDMVKEHMPAAADDVLILMCGPSPMIKFACLPSLKELGFDEAKHTFTF